MTAIASLSDLINRKTGGSSGTPENLWWMKYGRISGAADTAPVAGRLHSMWRYDGIPSGGAAPTSAAIPDNTTQGALGQADPGGGREKWLTEGCTAGVAAGVALLYDRLLHHGNASGTVTTAQTVGGTLTRNTGGVGNQIWIEIYTIVGTTATTITASYTNQAGTASRTTPAVAFGGTGLRESSRIIVLPLQATDTGVQSVQNITLAATTGTAGAFGVTVAKPLAWFPAPTIGSGPVVSLIDGIAIPEVDTGACLTLAWSSMATTAIEQIGTLSMVEA
jgi:hypothetical protein